MFFLHIYDATANITSTTSRTTAQADIAARKPIRAHLTISFHFVIFSSSPQEMVIISPPYTIAPIAKSERAVAIEFVQKTTFCLIPDSISPSPGFTSIESLPDKHPSKLDVIDAPALYEQAEKTSTLHRHKSIHIISPIYIQIFFIMFV